MERDVWLVQNERGEWWHGRSRWGGGWTGDFGKARTYNSQSHARNSVRQMRMVGGRPVRARIVLDDP